MCKKLFFILGVVLFMLSENCFCDWKYNPFTNKLDFYKSSTTLSTEGFGQSGINTTEDESYVVRSSTSINFKNYLNAYAQSGSSITNVYVDSTTLKTAIDTDTIYAKQYTVRIGSYTGYGITHVADGVDDQVTFFDAGQAAGSGGVVSVDPTMTYVFSSTCTVGTSSVTFVGNGAKLTFKAGIPVADNIFFTMVTTATDVTFDNFVFDGTGASGTHWTVNLSSIRWVIKNCIFQNFPTTSNGIMLKGNATGGTATNITFKKSTPTYAILNYGSNCNYSFINMDATVTGRVELRGNDITFVNSTCSGALFATASYVSRYLISNNIFSGMSTGLQLGAYKLAFVNNVVCNMTATGVSLSADSTENIISNNLFMTIGGTGDDADALYVGAPNCVITGNEFTGVIDRRCISLAATAINTTIANNSFVNATGTTANIYDLGYSNQAIGNLPITENYMLSLDSATVTGMPTATPKFRNTLVMADTGTLWISTGTANASDWKSPSVLPYAEFSSSSTQVMTTAGVHYPIVYDYAESNSGFLWTTGTSTITVIQSGVYLITFSAIAQTVDSNKNINIWIQKNGAPVARSNTHSHFVDSASERLITVTYLESFSAGNTFQLKMNSDVNAAQLTATAASGDCPASPSIIMTINKISD